MTQTVETLLVSFEKLTEVKNMIWQLRKFSVRPNFPTWINK